MRAIIRGKRYDTTTAILIGAAGYNGSRTDFAYWEASLYKTPRGGTYFLAGRGGPMTRWARSVDGGGYTGGSGIKPISAEDALEWAEQYLSTDLVEREFAATVTDA